MTTYPPHPGVSDGMAVPTSAAFFALPRPPGWTYELHEGRLHLEPDWRVEIARYAGPPAALLPDGVRLRVPDHVPAPAAVLALADRAFAPTPDFFGASPDARAAALRTLIDGALAHEPPPIRSASTVAVDREERVVGVLLVREVSAGAAVRLAAVDPGHQRRGIGRALVAAARAALDPSVDLFSSWLLAHRESAAWHAASDFLVVPTSIAAGSRCRSLTWEARAGRESPAVAAAACADERRLAAAESAGSRPDPAAYLEPLHQR